MVRARAKWAPYLLRAHSRPGGPRDRALPRPQFARALSRGVRPLNSAVLRRRMCSGNAHEKGAVSLLAGRRPARVEAFPPRHGVDPWHVPRAWPPRRAHGALAPPLVRRDGHFRSVHHVLAHLYRARAQGGLYGLSAHGVRLRPPPSAPPSPPGAAAPPPVAALALTFPLLSRNRRPGCASAPCRGMTTATCLTRSAAPSSTPPRPRTKCHTIAPCPPGAL